MDSDITVRVVACCTAAAAVQLGYSFFVAQLVHPIRRIAKM